MVEQGAARVALAGETGNLVGSLVIEVLVAVVVSAICLLCFDRVSWLGWCYILCSSACAFLIWELTWAILTNSKRENQQQLQQQQQQQQQGSMGQQNTSLLRAAVTKPTIENGQSPSGDLQ